MADSGSPRKGTGSRQVAEDVDERSAIAQAKTFRTMTQAERIDAFAPEILARHADGETITDICNFAVVPPITPDDRPRLVLREKGTFPDRTTFYGWVHAEPALAQRFAHARALWREALRDSIMEIADDGRRDFIPTKDGYILDTEHVQRSKLRIYAREQLLDRAKWQGMLGDEAADKARPAALPPQILVVGIEPRGMPGPGRDIEGEAVRVDDDELEPL